MTTPPPEEPPPDPRAQVAMLWAQLREDWVEADRWAKKFGAVRELRQGETPDVRELNKFLEAVQAVRSTGALLREPLKALAAERRQTSMPRRPT